MRWVLALASGCGMFVLGCDGAVVERQVAVAQRRAAEAELRVEQAEQALAKATLRVEALEKQATELEELAKKAVAQAEAAEQRELPSPGTTPSVDTSTTQAGSTSDCDKLGEKIVEMAVAEGASAGLSEEQMRKVIEPIGVEAVKECKKKPPSKQELDCFLAAKNLEDMDKCE